VGSDFLTSICTLSDFFVVDEADLGSGFGSGAGLGAGAAFGAGAGLGGGGGGGGDDFFLFKLIFISNLRE
jgi:hypothetical protein